MLAALRLNGRRSSGEAQLQPALHAGVAQLVCAVLWPGDFAGISLGALATVVGVLLGAAWLPQPPPSGITFWLHMTRCV